MKQKIKEALFYILAGLFLAGIAFAIGSSVVNFCIKRDTYKSIPEYQYIEVWNKETETYEEYALDAYKFEDGGVHVKIDGEWFFVYGIPFAMSYNP